MTRNQENKPMRLISSRLLASVAAAAACCGAIGTAQAADRAPVVMGTPGNTFRTDLLPPGTVRPNGPVTAIAPGDAVGPISRVTVFSRDRSRALILYKDILGMTRLTDAYWRGVAINRVKGTEGLEQHAVILMAGVSGEGNIGIYQLYREKFAPPPIDTSAVIKTGDYALTFTTNDVQKIYGRVQEIGFTIITPPTVQPAGSQFAGATKLAIRGPDGVIVNFVQPPK